jgi:hypothetical protein
MLRARVRREEAMVHGVRKGEGRGAADAAQEVSLSTGPPVCV